MRSLLAAALGLLATLVPHGAASQHELQRQPQVLEHNTETSYTRFTAPCLAPGDRSGADDYLEFRVKVLAEDSPSGLLGFTLNGRKLDLQFTELPVESIGSVVAQGGLGDNHTVHFTVWSSTLPGRDNAVRQIVRFQPHAIDSVASSSPGFSIVAGRSFSPYLQALAVISGPAYPMHTVIDQGVVKSGYASADLGSVSDDSLQDELDALYLLETQAENLQEQIVAKKRVIGQYLKDERAHVPLRALLEECDGLICAAQVIAQKLCDKMGVVPEPSLSYARKHSSGLQHAFGGPHVQQNARNCTKSRLPFSEKHSNSSAQGLNVQFTVTKNSSTTDYHLIDGDLSPNPFLRAITIVASILGLCALFRFIRRRCMSMRKRVERAADREERRNARAYRKAARRAHMRRRWDNLVTSMSCLCVSRDPPPTQDYEEKRALILQDAFLEQLDDLDQAEKGELMEAEIRELRNAREIVASLVRRQDEEDGRYAPMRFVPDPPPPLVALPLTPTSRSRASTGTLPSYTSESLPSYSSRPGTLADHNSSSSSTTSDSLVDGYTPTTTSSSNEGQQTAPASTMSSAAARYTPTSSVLDVSPRVSEETLRTRRSGGTHGS